MVHQAKTVRHGGGCCTHAIEWFVRPSFQYKKAGVHGQPGFLAELFPLHRHFYSLATKATIQVMPPGVVFRRKQVVADGRDART